MTFSKLAHVTSFRWYRTAWGAFDWIRHWRVVSPYIHWKFCFSTSVLIVPNQSRAISGYGRVSRGFILRIRVYWKLRVWASYQIRKIAGCACAGNAGNVFPRRRFQRKPIVGDPGMHHGTCVTHVPWCMSGSLTCGDGENVPGIPGACAPAILRIWQEAQGKIAMIWLLLHVKISWNKPYLFSYIICFLLSFTGWSIYFYMVLKGFHICGHISL